MDRSLAVETNHMIQPIICILYVTTSVAKQAHASIVLNLLPEQMAQMAHRQDMKKWWGFLPKCYFYLRRMPFYSENIITFLYNIGCLKGWKHHKAWSQKPTNIPSGDWSWKSTPNGLAAYRTSACSFTGSSSSSSSSSAAWCKVLGPKKWILNDEMNHPGLLGQQPTNIWKWESKSQKKKLVVRLGIN